MVSNMFVHIINFTVAIREAKFQSYRLINTNQNKFNCFNEVFIKHSIWE